MQKLLCFVLLLTTLAGSALAQREIGYVDVVAEKNTVPVRVSANNAELDQLARQAFGSHGRYRVTGSGYVYDIKFSLAATNQVRVDITRSGGAAVASEVVSGSSTRNALLKAADVAVMKTNGLGLRGFFASQLTFIGQMTGKKEVYIAHDLFFGNVKQITQDRAHALTPRWSPDGTKIVYTSYLRTGFPDIYQIDTRTFQRTALVSLKGTNSGARFSPTGQQITMVLTGEGTPEIYVANAQGRQIARRTRSDAVKSSPCFSPDGTRIVFAMEPGPQLFVMPAGGGQPTRLTSGISGYCAEPDWSTANPNKIAFTMRVGRNYQIGVFDLSTRKGGQVSKAPFDGIEAAWLPDGRHVVYTARTATTSRLCILDTETGKSVPISPSSAGAVMQASVLAR